MTQYYGFYYWFGVKRAVVVIFLALQTQALCVFVFVEWRGEEKRAISGQIKGGMGNWRGDALQKMTILSSPDVLQRVEISAVCFKHL